MTKLPTQLICVDWGTTNLRAYLITANGEIVAQRQSPEGILNVPSGGFAEVLTNLISDWRIQGDEQIPVLLSGMIGSKQGWIEAPYASCPVSPSDLCHQLSSVPNQAQMWIVPGVCIQDPPDVMRGEEVQVFGALDLLKTNDGLFCLPGTHSKWISVNQGRVEHFATAMTGELFATLKNHTILGRLMPEASATEFDQNAFCQGLATAKKDGGLLHHLFSVRTLGLFERLPASALQSYLSGLLIGHEIQDLGFNMIHQHEVILLGAPALCQRYQEALTYFKCRSRVISNDDVTVQGLKRIAQEAKIISGS